MASKKQKDLAKTLAKFYRKPVTKVSLELFFSLFAIMFFTIFAIKPTLETIAGLIQEIEEKEQLDEQLQRKIAALSTAQDEYERLAPKIEFLDQAIPTQPQLVYSLKIIERAAAENNVVISSARLPEIPEEKELNAISNSLERLDLYLNVRILGDYPSMRDFVNTLQGYRRTFVVEEVSFSVEDRVSSRQLGSSLSIRMPYFGDSNAK